MNGAFRGPATTKDHLECAVLEGGNQEAFPEADLDDTPETETEETETVPRPTGSSSALQLVLLSSFAENGI